MNTRAFADASLTAIPPAAVERATVTTRPDVLFLLNNLGIGGSERKIVRLANRLRDEGVLVSLACLNGPFAIESHIRADVPLQKLERTGKLSLGAVWRLRRLIARDRPATVIAVNLYSSLYVMLACLMLPYR